MANLFNKAGLVNIPSGYGSGKLENVKPIDPTLGFRFNRDSAATRVNKEGLIEQVGYFGPELVKNGNFSELGSELIPDGNFTNQAAVDYWRIADTGGVERATKSLENGFMRLTYDIANGSALYKSGIVTSGKSYKVTFRAKGTANSNFNSIGDNVNIPSNPQYVVSNPTLTDDWQDYEFYVPVSSTTLRLYLTSAQIGDTLDITNISVKQVDPNDYWTLGTGWIFGDGVATCDGSQTSGTFLQQTPITFTNGNTYKVVFTCTIQAGNLDARLQGGGPAVTGTSKTSSGTYTEYLVSTGNTSFRMRGNDDFIGSITNISVIKVLGDKPRIDYTDSLTSPSFLLEPQSTNLYTDSNNFLSWSVAGSLTLTPNYTISPSGENNATRLQWGSGTNFLYKTLSHVGNNFTNSFYIKSNTSINQYLRLFLDNGAQSQEETITPQWQRFTFTNLVTPTQSNRNVGLIRSTNQVGDLDVSIAFSQFEALSYATSYIPTAGSTATRAQETCNGAGSASTFNDSEGVLYAEIAALADDSTNRHITLSDGSDNNRLVLKYDNQSNVIQAFNRVGGVETASLSASVTDITLFSKCAVKYKVNDYALWIDGVEVATDTNATTFPSSTLNDLKFGESGANSNFYGRTKGIYVFNEALTDDELQQLTGPEYNSFAALAAAYNYTVI